MKRNILIVLLLIILALTGGGISQVLAQEPPENMIGVTNYAEDIETNERGSAIPMVELAAGISPIENIIVGPFEVRPVVEIISEEIERFSTMDGTFVPGDKLIKVSWTIRNLTDEPKYVQQYSWSSSDTGYVPLRTVYAVTGNGSQASGWSNKFCITEGGEIIITTTVYLGDETPPTKNAVVQIVRPKLTISPSGDGKGAGGPG